MVTLTDTKAYLGISVSTYDTLLTSFIGLITAEIESEIDRKIVQTTISGEVLKFQYSRFDTMPIPPFGLMGEYPKLYTRQYPVSSLSLYDDTDLLTVAEDYSLNSANGEIEVYTTLSDEKNNLTATYTSGYPVTVSSSSVPKDLQLVAFQGIKELFQQSATTTQNNTQAITSKTVGDYSVNYDSKAQITTKDYLENNSRILNRYKTINI